MKQINTSQMITVITWIHYLGDSQQRFVCWHIKWKHKYIPDSMIDALKDRVSSFSWRNI